ncbi:MAG: glycosyltransferase [Propionibacteriaceae bacterium]|jgi:GT2 family glycosyltransferase|nr:glycosyltransferase [Propionibacteriaceae bacterium]
MTDTDSWSWFDAPERSDVDLSGHDVTAVLVCRNAESWLNATLAGLASLEHRPEMIVAVDNQSSDNTNQLLNDALAAGMIDEIISGQASFSFGESVEHALSLQKQTTRWIWLLHDDAVPDPNALTELLELGARTPRLTIAVPLLVRPTRRHHAARTLEIGASISGSGERALGLEPDEVAQGQYESKSVLGGSTCGMLVDWQSFFELGGFDSAILGYRDGVDLGWRAQLADRWVMTCPTAKMIHRQVGRAEIRRGTLASQAHRSEDAWDRLMGLRLVAAHARGLRRVAMLARLTIVCWLKALVYLFGRAPDRARDELQAWSDLVFRSHRPVVRLAKKIKGVAQSGRDTRYRIRSLRPTLGKVFSDGWHVFTRWFQEQFSSNRDTEITLDDLLGDEFTRRLGEGRRRVPTVVWVVLVVAAVALMARPLYTNGLVTASQLLGAPQISHLFEQAQSPAGASSPWMLLAACWSVLTIKASWLPVVALIAGFPLTCLIAAWYSNERIRHRRLRWAASAGYALLPLIMGAGNRGAIWIFLLAMTLPFAAEWLSRLDLPWSGARSLQPLAGLVIAGIVIWSILPVMWLPIMVVAIVIAAYAGGTARIIRVVIAMLAPIAIFARSIPSLVGQPARLLLTPEAMLNDQPLGWQQLLARSVAVGTPPLWLSAVVVGVIWLGMLVAVLRVGQQRWLALAGVACVAVAIWLSRLVLPLDGVSVFSDPTPWLLAGFALMLFAGVVWLDRTLASLQGRDFSGRHALAGLLSLLMAISFVLGAGWSAWSGLSLVHRGDDLAIPEYLAENERDLDSATLVIDASARHWNMRVEGQSFWGQGSFASGALADTQARAELDGVVAHALSGRLDDQAADQLATFGVSTVVVLQSDPTITAAIDATAGFQRATASDATQIWNVTISLPDGSTLIPTRRQVTSDTTGTDYLSARDTIAADSGGTLTLALPPDPDRHVFVGDTEVSAVASADWRAAYSIGSADGAISLRYDSGQAWVAWVQLVVLILLVVFVLPPLADQGAPGGRYRVRSGR